jgi:hypothetical protein
VTDDELLTDTPARERLATDLFAWGQPRPPVPTELARELRRQLEDGLGELGEELAQAAAGEPRATILVAKSRLDRLSCDGWQLDPVPYEHTDANARGSLTHAAIEQDLRGARDEAADQLVARVWTQVASDRPGDPTSLSWWLNHRPPEDAAELRAQVVDLLEGFREVWPPLPPRLVSVRTEQRIALPLAGGRVRLFGVPDVILDSRRRDERARALVVDLKTGRPRSQHDRHELRFYALLTTLASGRPPFRWATFYVTEGRAEAEDLRPATLEATVRRVIDGVAQRVRLARRTSDDELRLRAGSWCRFCLRQDHCEVARAAAMSQADGMVGP